jgi:3-phenylpropionate/cinnamic acid dioxygenase small subunit
VTAEATFEQTEGAARRPQSSAYPAPQGVRIPVGDPRHFEVVAFLEDESALLDNDELLAWINLLAPEIVYRAPVRVTRDNASGPFENDMFHFNENGMTLMLKIMRLTHTESAWAENPASRTHRIVHKVRAYETDVANEYEVHSSVVLLRSRYDDPALETLPARRIDRVRAGEDWKLVSRTLYFEQATLGVQNLAVYL